MFPLAHNRENPSENACVTWKRCQPVSHQPDGRVREPVIGSWLALRAGVIHKSSRLEKGVIDDDRAFRIDAGRFGRV